ncbi:hypothetical protein BU23DRAFT_574763 [Bimuria novae-zelandiae CBS 107.79]|uniref:Uncharacterized protein n=1 Tax=Bimuria novae-zelandiae CBS 107.79 TaxID=1447943 RepID=A0A6A5UX57_9PLEO|nr:hypothetical protein BU23DRAFT_574763 [Bimuria novae-zelandiae CBS 107.79]
MPHGQIMNSSFRFHFIPLKAHYDPNWPTNTVAGWNSYSEDNYPEFYYESGDDSDDDSDDESNPTPIAQPASAPAPQPPQAPNPTPMEAAIMPVLQEFVQTIQSMPNPVADFHANLHENMAALDNALGAAFNALQAAGIPTGLMPSVGIPIGNGISVGFQIMQLPSAPHGDHPQVAGEAWASDFVASSPMVDHSEIPADDMRCPGCWLDFGETDEFNELYEPPELPQDPQEAEAIIAAQSLPFDARCPNNNSVRLLCGHLWAHDCLIDTLCRSTLCLICRRELRN